MKKISLMVAAAMLSALPSPALASSDNTRCERAMPTFFVWVPCWINWANRG